MATILPAIFLAVAAALTNAVLARLIASERREISLLKAFGYSNAEVGWHYAKLALSMAFFGVLLGWALGAGLGRYNTQLYSDFFRFPFLFYRPSGAEFAISAAVALGAALMGAGTAVRRAIDLPPAEAMRPPAPTSFRKAQLPEGIARRLDTPTRIILRQIARTPIRALVTVAGVSLSLAVLITALQWNDAITLMVRSQFNDSQRQSLMITFHEPRAERARHALARLPGVMAVEPRRAVRTDLRAGSRLHRGVLTGLPSGAWLQAIHDVGGWTLPVPAGGVVIGSVLAEKLGVTPGDRVWIEVLEGAHPRFSLEVAAVFETWVDMPAIVDLDRLNREMGDPPVFDEAGLLVDSKEEDALFQALREMPGISAVMVKRHAIATMFDTLGETILIFTSFFVVFACTLTGGVIYNAARIALSERARELATLRVLGFTRWEISYILIGETALLLLVSLPLGCLAGRSLSMLIGEAFATELYRVPLIVLPSVYGTAVMVVLTASIVSAALVRRRLDRLDLIAVLKTRE
jgi:putative ABC transport system permease protein